jgi:hypothetical protein
MQKKSLFKDFNKLQQFHGENFDAVFGCGQIKNLTLLGFMNQQQEIPQVNLGMV